jgi:hypothetical protein
MISSDDDGGWQSNTFEPCPKDPGSFLKPTRVTFFTVS